MANQRPSRNARVYNLSQVLDILDAIDPNDSDVGAESTDDEDYTVADGDDGDEPEDSPPSDSDEEEPAPLPSTSSMSTAAKKKPTFVWTKDRFEPPDSTFRGELFKLPEDYELPSPLHFFKEFLSDDMLELVVTMTNLYSVEKNGKSADITVKEFQQVIGMFFRMGLAKMPGNRCYWETDARYEPVAGVMSRNRFQLILTVIHFVENNHVSEEERADKLWKIRPWLEKFRSNCLKVVPEEQNSIDEMMIPFKGKFSKLKQYIKGKPHPWGIKVWARTGSSGILCDFDVYQGNREGKTKSVLGVGADVVLKLCQSLPPNVPGQPALNYKVTADNFFTGMPLLMKLAEDGFHYTGTVRPNRLPGVKMETENVMKKKGRGCMDQCVEKESNIAAVRWYDTRSVTTLSTYMGATPTHTVRRYDKTQKKHVLVQRPAIIKAYNEHMGGVDLLDCFVAKHTYRMKSKRWYLYIFWHTLRITMVNAWLSYRRACELLRVPKRDVLNQRKFQARVATLLIELNAGNGRKRGRPSLADSTPPPGPKKKTFQPMPQPEVRQDGYYFHFPVKSDQRQRCKKCQLKCNNVCEKCKVYLCYTEQRNCFRDFHLA